MRCVLNSSTLPATSTAWPNLRSLYERLQMAEVLGEQVSRDLNIILEELKNVSKATNATGPTSNTTSNFFPGSVFEMYVQPPGLDQPMLYDGTWLFSLTVSNSVHTLCVYHLIIIITEQFFCCWCYC